MLNPVVLFFGVMAVLFSILVIAKRNPVTSALNLVLVFFCLAALYALEGAHLIAGFQVLVYAGAIMVLFIFVIMLLNVDVASFDLSQSSLPYKLVAICAGLGVALLNIGIMGSSVQSISVAPEMTVEKIEQIGGNSYVISHLLFAKFLIPFELTSVLLLVAIVGSVALAKRQKNRSARL